MLTLKMSKEQEQQMLELKYKMEKLKSEMEDVKQKDKTIKMYDIEASLHPKRNLDFIEEWLEKSSILKDYYDSDNKATHWYGRKGDIMLHPDVKNYIHKSKINLETTLEPNLFYEYRKVLDNIETKVKEMLDFYTPAIERGPSLYIFKGHNHNHTNYPGPAEIKFVQSVFNMFKIQQKKIDKLEKNIDKIFKRL